MNRTVVRCCILLFCFLGEVVSVCRQGPYPNLCGYNGNEYNVTETEQVEMLCDCQKAVFCSIINFTKECNTTFQLDIYENVTLSTQLHCDILPAESQASIPTLDVVNSNGGTFFVRFSDDSQFGMYTVFCTLSEISCNPNKTSSTEWEIVSVNPEEVFVDFQVKFQLVLNEDVDMDTISTLAWCFVNTPDNNIEVLSATPASEGRVTCAGFTPAVPGLFVVSLATEFSPTTFEKGVSVNGVAKRPVAQQAKYDFDFKTIFIYFDGNIELRSTCQDTFPKTYVEYFGVGFDCFAGGNTLKVKMGAKFKIINNLMIKSENRICREGSLGAGFCLSALSANLSVSKPKVSGPSLSFYKLNACGDNKTQNHMNVRVIHSNRTSLASQNETFRAESPGKTHRKNLMMWRSFRQVQNKLSSRLILQVNRTDMVSLFENLSAFDGILDVGDVNLGSGASVSVHVQSSPGTSSLSAEAHVRFCNESVRLFRYNWLLNGRNLSEEGRLLTLRMLPPGKYLINCLVVAFDSGEIFGQGWASAQVLEYAEEVFVVPAEVVVGMEDDIFLRAVPRHGNSVTWTCRMASGRACPPRDGHLSPSVRYLSVSIPAGSLPVGEYIWTAESLGRSGSAKVVVKPGGVTVIVKMASVFANPSLGVVLNGSVLRAKGVCRAGWTSVRHKGFSYLDLGTVGVKEISVEEQHPELELPLAILPSSRNSGVMQPDSLYLFKLEAFCPQSGSFSYVKVPVRISAPPAVPPPTVKPSAGEAMTTTFEVSGAEADVVVGDRLFVYEWSYVDPCDHEIPLGRGLTARNFTTYLPPGDMKIMVRACDEMEICSTSVSPTVAVIQPPQLHRENFEKSLSQMQYSMLSGDDSVAFGLAVTMLRSLALTAEFKIRWKVLSAVEEAVAIRMKALSEKLGSDPLAAKLSLKFCESAETVAKYFRKGSAILSRLADFRNSLTKYAELE